MQIQEALWRKLNNLKPFSLAAIKNFAFPKKPKKMLLNHADQKK